MDKTAQDVLKKNLVKIKESNASPAWLAGELLAADIIGVNDVEKAGNGGELEAERRGRLVLTVMGNGAPGVFQRFVDILIKESHLKWLGQKLKDDFIQAGGEEWSKGHTQGASGPAVSHSEEGRNKRATVAHSTNSSAFTKLNILDVLEKVGFSTAHWRELGMRLMPDLDLDGIEADHPKADRRLEEVISRWMRDGDDPSWNTLAEAVSLCKKGGGKNMALKIKQETTD